MIYCVDIVWMFRFLSGPNCLGWMVEIAGIVRCLSGVVGTNVIVLGAYLAVDQQST